MKIELIFTLVLLCAVLPIKGQKTCQSKMLVNPDGTWNGENLEDKIDDYIDQINDIGHTIAYNGVHSCYTLQPNDDGTNTYLTCCYLEYKFKIQSNEDVYTSRACIPIRADQINGDIDNFESSVIDVLENGIREKANGVIEEVKEVSVVCSKSSFLKVSALLLLAFLL